MKNWKMRSAIMVIVLVTSLIGIGALFLMASSRNQKALSESTSDNTATYHGILQFPRQLGGIVYRELGHDGVDVSEFRFRKECEK